ncbi:unnamed protein product [Schistosoma margrebowiei]|uniref:Uncharacterized protein n=1 Tax=Schistosoma margrebowiei TaxID=48269 RepID=A0A183LP86_9TREM|nr:unnamed protein product [Schistosoma margrebowiei]
MRTSTSEGKHGIQWTAQNQLDDLDFADDLALLPRTHEQMQMKTASIAAVSASIGFNIHKEKTKVLKYNTDNTNPITLDGETLEDVESFTYLESIIDEHGGSDADVKARIVKARAASLQLKNIWNSKQLSTNIKGINVLSLNNRASNKKIAKRYKRLQRILNAQLKQQQQQQKSETNQQSVQRNKQNYIKQRSRRLAQYQRRHNRASQDRYYYSDLDSTNEIVEDHDINEDVSSHRKITHNSYENNRENHHSQQQQQHQQYRYDITKSYSNVLQTNNHHYLDTTCQRRELIINFDAVGWAGWVIAPQAYNARYCLGQCPFPLSTHYNTTNHAVLLQLVHLLDVARISGPCCVPHQLSSQSLLYHSQNGDVVLRVYEDMVVESCACR